MAMTITDLTQEKEQTKCTNLILRMATVIIAINNVNTFRLDGSINISGEVYAEVRDLANSFNLNE